MSEWSVIQPVSQEQWEAYYRLRFDVLRAPWNQEPGSERAEDDDKSVHGMIIDNNGKALAVGRIHRSNDGEAQIRFMAVDPQYQRRGLGKAILRYIEHVGKKSLGPLNSIYLQAREEAVNFYRENGYTVKDKTFILFDDIQHYLMAKDLEPEE